MTATTSTVQCTTPNCPNPATDTLPIYVPGDEKDVVCRKCLDAYWDCRRTLEAMRY
ncbi:MAG: hypothetical protein JWN03_1468 [Nocardia sp.]|uniref:hypothetical protein n=1 Tax=Nocardia sp. TaxID=1821 RepID=UPI00263111A3|nr:hypothetical protein [Nocardia sp.]MCU1641193.1 hypothetical protein [Nocardia sp.]